MYFNPSAELNDKTLPFGWGLSVFISVLSGVFFALSLPPYSWWFFSLFCWIPLLLFIPSLSLGRSFILGWSVGFFSFLLVGNEFPYSLHSLLGGSPELSYALGYAYLAYLAVQIGLMFLLTSLLLRRHISISVALPGAWLVTEILFPAPAKFSLAYSVYDVPLLLQVAELGGEKLVGIGILMTNGFLAALLIENSRSKHSYSWRFTQFSVFAVLSCMVLFGFFRLHQSYESNQETTIGMMHLDDKPLPIGVRKRQRFLDNLMELSAKNSQQRTFDVYPETILNLSQTLRVSQHQWPVPSIVGATSRLSDQRISLYQADGGKIHRTANSALLLNNGKVDGRYDKQHLLVGGEYLPSHPMLQWLRDLFPNAGAHSVIPEHSLPLNLDENKLLALICYEELLGSFVAQQMRDTPSQMLIGLSSSSVFKGKAEALVHRAGARFRAVETRRYFIRSSRGGWSEIIDPLGVAKISVGPEDSTRLIKGSVSFLNEQTLYTQLGDLPWKVVTALILIYLLLPTHVFKRHSRCSNPH